ncbi:dolichol-phosphate mannosyltransferase [Lacibacter cauensis]|uniref:Dolichol-phosphate mannosyltransferase n=1 Tax=Lacibacter cauensis TaxID=510947 RepID=A0A562SDR2_9BACT|nr:glycosyltransferase family 2 protein [Lacibacter cauensis]TWI79084.1 dolichol-phosphate mannosyltransferase [Lacibacter cauensis]
MPQVSILIPVMNEAENIVPLYHEIKKYSPEDFELIFINDGSTDDTFSAIKQLYLTDSRVKCISFSRNFGHQNALMAGIDYATGSHIVTMDGDLQHPPSFIPQILEQLQNGYDVVLTKRRKTANQGFLKKLLTKLFYKLINFLSDVPIEENVSDFRGFSRKVMHTIRKFEERDLFLRGVFSWVGYRRTIIPFDAPSRLHGKSKYNFTAMIRLGLKGTTSFSFKPLRISLLIGSIVSLISFLLLAITVINYFQGKTVPGWASLMTVVTFMGGIQLLVFGLMGEYIASLFRESKKRPLYIIDEMINVD